MAENLMERIVPYEERNAAPGFGYAGGTQDILTAYNGLNHRGANIRYAANQPLLKEQLDYLYSLKQELLQQEDAFFELFNIYDKTDKKNSFLKLKKKIEEWNETGANNLINDASKGNIFYKGLGAIKQMAIQAELDEEDWEGLIMGTLVTVDEKEMETILNETDGNIAKIMNIIIDDNKKFAIRKNSSLVANLRIALIDDKLVIDGDRDKVSPTLQLKLIRKLKKHLKIDGKPREVKPRYDFEKMFNELFVQTGINPTGQKYIKQAIKEDFSYEAILNDYAFNSNTSTIKGFLGEIYNNAFLCFMADGSESKKQALQRITPTGAMREIGGTRPELVIDTWLDGFGIQVKNYEKNKVMREGFTFKNDMGAGEFILNKLQLSSAGTSNTASVGDILLNFFTAYDYNQDYGKTGKLSEQAKNSDAYKYWLNTRARMTEKIRDEVAFTNIIMPYATKLLGVDRQFSADGSLFVEERIYHNTFFNISGNYIPSSVLIQAIIDTIEKKTNNQSFNALINLQARFKSHKLSNKDKWKPSVDNNIVADVFNAREEYANSSKVEYELTLNMNELVNNLLDYIS